MVTVIESRRLDDEWLETDGLGGFTSGTVAGWRTRRYHGLLVPAVDPPAERAVLVAGFDAWLETAGSRIPLSAQRYLPDVIHPDGQTRLVHFTIDPWPTWRWALPGGLEVVQEILVPQGRAAVMVRWELHGEAEEARLIVRPFLAGRDSHALHDENPGCRFDAEVEGERVRWRPYGGLPTILSLANAGYRHGPLWYRNFLLTEERARGFEHREDLSSPGELEWNLAAGEAVWLLGAEGLAGADTLLKGRATTIATRLRNAERKRRGAFPSRLHRAADQYLVRRGQGMTIIAGYPWFTDWGRDTFIALRGLCLAGDRLPDARAILVEWAGTVSEGMLPNRFVEHGAPPEFNSVDASLWYVVAAHEFLTAMDTARRRLPAAERARILAAVAAILEGYAAGTRYRIGMDADGLIRAGIPGVQLTWMDAKVGDWVVTPRIGKPVEIQALWINALRIGARHDDRWSAVHDRALGAFRDRFWNEAGACLYDVVDVDHRPGTVDPLFRPNQIFAVGGLPFPLLEGDRARRVVDAVEARLWTPLGARSLAPGEPGYAAHYEGGPRERDGAYHQGTVWPWLAGPFVEAWLRVRGDTPETRREARTRFYRGLEAHLDQAGLGHVSEIADAEPPYTPRGCPFQAWSVGEMLRLDRAILVDSTPAPPRRSSRRSRP
jgi:predicted glycogen debranching enzyme